MDIQKKIPLLLLAGGLAMELNLNRDLIREYWECVNGNPPIEITSGRKGDGTPFPSRREGGGTREKGSILVGVG